MGAGDLAFYQFLALCHVGKVNQNIGVQQVTIHASF
jgi:hypothetical protein